MSTTDSETTDRKILVEHVARAIAAEDQEDYMEDWVRYDRRAIAAIKAYQELGSGSVS